MTEPPATHPVEQLPEPARFWIAYAPRSWRSAPGLWTDLASGRLKGSRASGATIPDLEASDLDDLFYLPPVAPEHAEERDRLASEMMAHGTPVLVQLRPGESTAAEGAQVVYDLLDGLLDGELSHFSDLPYGSAAVWPLIAGISDRRDVWDRGCSALANGGVRVVQALVVEMTPQMRRHLAEDRDGDAFDALFHGEQPSERTFAIWARGFGLDPFVPRLVVGRSPMQIRNRRIASDLALAGELWLRLQRKVATGHALFRAARGAEHTRHDLTALVREENLSQMNWLDAHSIGVVEEIVRTGGASLLQELLDEYLELESIFD